MLECLLSGEFIIFKLFLKEYVLIKILGWFSIVITILALAPSFVPGAMSLFAFYLSLVMLVTSIATIKRTGDFYFKTTAIVVCVGMLIINDYIRLFGSFSHATWGEKLGMYAFYMVIYIIGFLKVKRCSKPIK